MIVVGLTGGIASGKSFVVKYLDKINITSHDSDKVISDLYSSGDKNLTSFLLKSGFKKSLLNNGINKKIIRDIIFSNTEKRIKLEKYLHSRVKKSRDVFIRINKKKKRKIVFLDIPLLFENKLESLCDVICSTIAPLNLRENRALQRPGMKKKIFKQIVKNQVADKYRKKKSDYLIDTSKTRKKTYLQVDVLIYDALKKWQ
jgi:dephospho-CoA kinase